MKYYFRLLWLVLTRHRRPRCALTGPCRTDFRVLPNDLDVLGHMNNGAYLTIADLGRTDLLLRAGLFGPIRQRGWYPVVAAETIRFRRSLRPFQRYSITTRVLAWTARSFYLEQHFERRGETIAVALIDVRFLAGVAGPVATSDVLSLSAQGVESPPLPAWIENWTASMREMASRRD